MLREGSTSPDEKLRQATTPLPASCRASEARPSCGAANAYMFLVCVGYNLEVRSGVSN